MTLIVFGTPAIALAGTSGSGSGPGQPGQVTIAPGQVTIGPGLVALACPRPHGKPVRVKFLHPKFKRLPKGVRFRKIARFHLACRVPRGCPPAFLTFDMASGSSTVTEVRGPVLAPPEEFAYDGHIYTIMSVNPGADSFTVFRDNVLFVNDGPAITGATGVMVCAPPPVLQKSF